jgi:hypothetical protein
MPGNVGSHVIVLGVPVPAKFSFLSHKIKARPPKLKIIQPNSRLLETYYNIMVSLGFVE